MRSGNVNACVGKALLKSRVILLPICLSLFGFFCAESLLSQVETGRIIGTVTDVTGAVVPDAEVTIVAVATNRHHTFVTNNGGRYSSGPLQVGEYRVEVQMSGFKRLVREGISLEVQETAVLNLQLELGQLTEQVTVTAAQDLIRTTDASQGQVIDERRVQDLPLNGRDYIQLGLLSEGAMEPASGARVEGFSVGGQRTFSNNYTLDGFDNNNNEISASGDQGEAVKPSVDAIQEFKVQTNAYSAEFGKAAGGVINVTLKSGTNRFHGTVFEFLRNEELDARNFFDRADVPPFKRNDYGFSVGGPIIKNRAFFFFSHERLYRRESRTVNNTIPTLEMRRGDFSQLDSRIFDPATFDDTTRARNPFPNNVVPESRFDPVGKKLIDLFPQPQNQRLSQNFLFNPPDTQDLERINTRQDFHLSQSDTVSWMFNHQENDRPASLDLPAPALGGDSRAELVEAYNTGVTWNHVSSPTVVTSTKVGWNIIEDELSFAEEALELGDVNQQIGLNIPPTDLPVKFSEVNISGFQNLGAGNFVGFRDDGQVRQFINDTTWVKGNHSLKFGVNVQAIQNNVVNPRRELGEFRFSGRFTNDPLSATGGDAAADLLLGTTDSAFISTSTRLDGRAWLLGGYVQDEWQVRRRLTLNLGVRYEFFRPFEDRHDKLANFDIDTDPQNPRLLLATQAAGQRSTLEADTNNFGPRLGLAYQAIPNKLVVRAGYGIFYSFPRFAAAGDSESLVVNPPFTLQVSRLSDGVTPALLLRDGIPEDELSLENVTRVPLASFEREPAIGDSQQWNLNLQYQLGRDWLLQVGYFGTKGTHLPQTFDNNYVTSLGPGSINERRRYKSVTVPTIAGRTSGVVLSPLASVSRTEYTGDSIYHSLQAKFEHRFSQGFTLLGSWIWSRSIGDLLGDSLSGQAPGSEFQNPANLREERGLLGTHLTHRFVLSGIWELPFGRGRQFGSDLNPALDALLGGWSASGIVTLRSGRPFTVTVRGDPANSGQANRPDVVGDPEDVPGGQGVDEFFNTAAFRGNEPFTFGNLGRNNLLGPGFENVDFSLMKRTTLFTASDQPVDLQFRWEVFNLFNRPNFNFPGNTLGTPTFGELTSAGLARKMQFGLKVIF